VRAGRVSDHQIPALMQGGFYGLLEVVGGICFTGQQVAAPCVMAMTTECVTDPAAVFAGDEDAHQKSG